jgi:hypothetical protein
MPISFSNFPEDFEKNPASLAPKSEMELVKAERNPLGSGVRVNIIVLQWAIKKEP